MPIVYKYLPPERKTYLDDELLRFTQPGALNDPFECIPIIPKVDADKFVQGLIARNKPLLELRYANDKQALKRLKKALPKVTAQTRKRYKRNPEYLPNFFIDRYLCQANQNIGIFSLSRNWNSTLMWSHYTVSHTGFCVGFDSEHSFFSRQDDDFNDIGTLEPVDYAESRIETIIESGITIDVGLLHRKSIDWKYEEEERLVRQLKKANKLISTNPFDICLFTVPHSAISEIIYGVNAETDLKHKICSLGQSLGISVFEALISPTNFNIERKPHG